jgi:plasmid stability protein
MLVRMRTTMNLPDGLMDEVRNRARDSGRTVTSVVEEALRAFLDREPEPDPDFEPLPTWGTPGGRMLVDLEDKEALWAILDERP